MKLLIVCLGENGDLLLTTPVLRCLKQQLNNVEIHYLLQSHHKTVLEANRYVDQFHLNYGAGTDTAALGEENFDHIIQLQNDSVTAKTARTLKRPVLRVRTSPFQEFLFKNLGLNLIPKHSHIVYRYLDTIGPLGARSDGLGLDYFIPSKEELKENDIPASHHFGFVAITFAPSRTASQIPASKVQELCQAIDHPVVLIGGRNDFTKAEAIASFDPIKVYNACGKFTLHETADLIRKSKLVIAQDTDLAQIAAAFKKPVIGVWGSTYPLPDRVPYYGPGSMLYDEIRGNAKKIAVEEILRHVKRRLNGPLSPGGGT